MKWLQWLQTSHMNTTVLKNPKGSQLSGQTKFRESCHQRTVKALRCAPLGGFSPATNHREKWIWTTDTDALMALITPKSHSL